MSKLANLLAETGYADLILNERQIAAILKGSESRRYGLVNRALKDGSLKRLKRGLYVLGPGYRSTTIHPFAIAQAMLPGSYISMETALSYHGWIPEAVYETISITSGRKTLKYQHENYGQFTYLPLAIYRFQFLQSVRRHKAGTQMVLIADPLRALMDLVAYRKKAWTNMGWVERGLRIEPTHLSELSSTDFETLTPVYKQKLPQSFLEELRAETVGKINNPSLTQRK